jgi:hypothetical protein
MTQNLLVVDWAWLAGFIDGEGTITLSLYRKRDNTHGLYPEIIVAQKDRWVLDYIHQSVGMGSIKKNGNGSHVWYVRGTKVKALLDQLLSHLVVKQESAKLLIEFCERRIIAGWRGPFTERDWQIELEIRARNKKGRKVYWMSEGEVMPYVSDNSEPISS